MSLHRIVYEHQVNSSIKAIDLPASKSISNRLLILQYLSKQSFIISNLSNANDTKVLAAILKEKTLRNQINCEDAGTVLRFLTCLCAAKNKQDFKLSGTSRLLARPMHQLIDSLQSLGAKISLQENELSIEGAHLKSIPLEIDGNVSSQFITGLCLIASEIKNGLQLQIKEPVYSKPYIQMTLDLLTRFGIESSFSNNNIKIEAQEIKGKDIVVEADWSSACFFYAFLMLSDDVTSLQLNRLTQEDIQGDKYIASLALQFGIHSSYNSKGVLLQKRNITKLPKEIQLENYPDLAIPLITACAFKHPEVVFLGLEHLKHKESNRIEALKTNLEKFGIVLKEQNGQISLQKNTPLLKDNSVQIETFQDHRIAMSFALVAALGYTVELDNIACIDKSFPSFLNEISKLGFSLKI